MAARAGIAANARNVKRQKDRGGACTCQSDNPALAVPLSSSRASVASQPPDDQRHPCGGSKVDSGNRPTVKQQGAPVCAAVASVRSYLPTDPGRDQQDLQGGGERRGPEPPIAGHRSNWIGSTVAVSDPTVPVPPPSNTVTTTTTTTVHTTVPVTPTTTVPVTPTAVPVTPTTVPGTTSDGTNGANVWVSRRPVPTAAPAAAHLSLILAAATTVRRLMEQREASAGDVIGVACGTFHTGRASRFHRVFLLPSFDGNNCVFVGTGTPVDDRTWESIGISASYVTVENYAIKVLSL